MTGAMQGADVMDLRALAASVERLGHALETGLKQISARLYASTWEGRDAKAFHHQWQSTVRPLMSSNGQSLVATADRLREEARQQEQASNSTGVAGANGFQLRSSVGGLSGLGALSGPGRGSFGHNAWSVLPVSLLGLSGLASVAGFVKLAGKAGKFFGENSLVVGRYTNRWRRVIHYGGDLFKYKLSPVLQWGHRLAPALQGIGVLGGVVGLGAEAWATVTSKTVGDRLEHGVSTVIAGIDTAIGVASLAGRASPGLRAAGPVGAALGVNMAIWNQVGIAAAEAYDERDGLWKTLQAASAGDIGRALGEGSVEAVKRLGGNALWSVGKQAWKAFG